MTKAIIFDMDGLLIDSEPIWRQVEIHAFKGVGIELDEDMCRETAGWRLDHVIAHWFNKKPWQGKSREQLQLEIYGAMENAILESCEALPGAFEAVQYARSKGLKTAIATSSPMRLITAMTRRFSCQELFDVLHSAEFEEHAKPHPAVFSSTAQKLGVSAEECIAVEDSQPGIASAKGAGMVCIAVPEWRADLTYFMEADIVIDSLKSFPRALERILD